MAVGIPVRLCAALCLAAWLASSAPARAQLAVGLDFTACTRAECPSVPPDTVGAVGPEHVVHFNNAGYRVFRKSDATLLVSTSDFDFWVDAGLLPEGLAEASDETVEVTP